MNKLRTIARTLGAYLAATGIALASAEATPVIVPSAPADHVVTVAADCYAVGMRVAQQEGGQLAKATPESRGGGTVCVVVVVVPAKDGQRPRRKEVVVPAS
jgi:hypothetical protein